MLIKISNLVQKQLNSLKANNMQALMRKYLSCRSSSSSINDLTFGNNDTIATFLIYSTLIRQQARSYDVLNLKHIKHISAWVCTSANLNLWHNFNKRIKDNLTNKSTCGSNKKKITCSIPGGSVIYKLVYK